MGVGTLFDGGYKMQLYGPKLKVPVTCPQCRHSYEEAPSRYSTDLGVALWFACECGEELQGEMARLPITSTEQETRH